MPKAGYVIRRILRRAVRYGYTFLNQRSALCMGCCPLLLTIMGDAYSELETQKKLIEKVIKGKRNLFYVLWKQGIRLLDKVMEESKLQKEKYYKAVKCFCFCMILMVFPLDLTELIAKENNLQVDVSEFEVEMQNNEKELVMPQPLKQVTG